MCLSTFPKEINKNHKYQGIEASNPSTSSSIRESNTPDLQATPSTRRSNRAPSPGASAATNTSMIQSESTQEQQDNLQISKKRRLTQSEYLGMTSHFALFKESTDTLASLPHSASPEDTERQPQRSKNTFTTPIPGSEEIRRGVRILRLLKDIESYKAIAEAWVISTREGDFLGRPLVDLTFRSLQELSGLSLGKTESEIFALSAEIFKMFTHPIPICSSLSFDEYMRSMSYRWEIVGLAFLFVGMGTVFHTSWGSVFSEVEGSILGYTSRSELGEQAMNVTETCLGFCNEAGVLNDAVSWLNSQRTMLTTLIYGDRDYRSWRALGDLSTIIFSMGLNQPSSDPETPFWLLETRKRLMGHAFSADNQLATFLGRPPRISSRFCNVSLPLDLSFREIISDPDACTRAISRLDYNGWNTLQHDVQAVWLRVCLVMGPVRESILELSLNNQVEGLQSKVEQLLKQSEELWAGLPSFLHRKDNSEHLSQFPSVYLQLHMEYIYNRFLLYRILSKRLDIWSPDLVNVSIEILNEVLLLIDHRISMAKISPELSWVISYFGLSTAGVLSIELVRRANLNSTNILSNSTPFPRSRVIQSLSVFASYLQTIVHPNEGNYDICQQARETIRRVLDFVLSERSTPAFNSATSSQIPENVELTDGILDYNYYITHLDNWQFELQDTLQMF